MQITTYSGFSKRENSTKQPTGGTVRTIVLKEECDVYNPIFEISVDDFTINYVSAFGKYYYAKPVSIGNGRSRLVCNIDPMATYKTQIGNYKGLIEYAASSSKLTINDPRNTPTIAIQDTATNMAWVSGQGLNATDGCFILAYMSDSAGSSGLCTYAAMDWGALGELSYEFFSQSILDEIKDQFTAVKDSLVSLMWMPFNINDITGNVTSTITIGRQSITLTNHSVKIISARIKSLQTDSVQTRATVTGLNTGGALISYVNNPPYTTAELYLPYIGLVPINEQLLTEWGQSQTIHLKGAVDLLTGDIVYNLYMGGKRVSSFNGSVATHLPVSSASYNAFGAVGGALMTIGGVAATAAGIHAGSAFKIASGIIAGGHGITQTAQSMALQTQINGSNSSALGQQMGVTPQILYHTFEPAEMDLLSFQAPHGMPYFEVDTVSNLSGYVQCAAASVDITGNDEMKRAVNSMMNSGFYYE